MTANPQQGECDQRKLHGYLDDTLSESEQLRVEQHLCQCESCRNVMRDSAADQEWWGEAGEYLRNDRWDDVATTSVVMKNADPDGTPQVGDEPASEFSDRHLPLAMRQVREWLDPTDDPHMLGRFGGYEIVGIIGQGGMGVVMKGYEPALNRFVAIKVLAPLLASSGAARQRFAREAKATAAVLHDNVIPIHRVDETHDLPYLVMPYVADAPLQQRIDQEGPLPLVAVLRIGEQIAAGLAAAHSHGLVHRDIKPANILLENGVERVRITDFGLARAADDGSLTRTGVIAGTPQYMSPEQARGESVAARSDLFSLGSVLYVMATGRLPFRAETSYGILRRIIDTEPRPIREINPQLPPWLETIIAKLHAKTIQDRYASAEEVADLLRRCLAHVEQPMSLALPDECQSKSAEHRSTFGEIWAKVAKHRPTRVTMTVLGAVTALSLLIVGRATLLNQPQLHDPPSRTVDQAAAARTKVDDPADDPAVAWDGSDGEIERLWQDFETFESQAQRLWDGPPARPINTPTWQPSTTPSQESNP